MNEAYIKLGYLLASVLFIIGLKGLTHPRTAVRGNMFGALAMLLAVVVTLMASDMSFTWIVVGLVIGTAIGVVLAIILATVNVVGGFLVTNRMLSMFRKKKR